MLNVKITKQPFCWDGSLYKQGVIVISYFLSIFIRRANGKIKRLPKALGGK
jgi:hypothetical protein